MLLDDNQTHCMQSSFAKYCREGNQDLLLGKVNLKRAKVYRRLVANLVEDALSTAYPITRLILEDDEWYQLVKDFFSEYNSHTGKLWQMPKGLCEYVKQKEYSKKLGRPFLDDLLHFEWIEIEIYMMQDQPLPQDVKEGDFLENVVILSPYIELCLFFYPVFKAEGSKLEEKKGTYYLMVYRDIKTLDVHFMELSALYAGALDLLRQQEVSGVEALQVAAHHFDIPIDEKLMHEGKNFFEYLFKQGILLGCIPSNQQKELAC